MNKKVVIQTEEDIAVKEQKDKTLTCGIIMPIATMSTEYTSDHWSDVRHVLHKAIEKAGFIPRIVSDSEETTVIHGSIINNIYNDAIIVCDVSNKNANVMFELGMRLAFNKPVVIVKDDKTDYSFDTGNIQHEPYRKDLRHSTVEKFIDDLSKKITKTHEASQRDDYQSFLSYFGKFEVSKVENTQLGESEAIEKLLNKMNIIEREMKSLNTNNDDLSVPKTKSGYRVGPCDTIEIIYKTNFKENINSIKKAILLSVSEVKDIIYSNDRFYIYFKEAFDMNERKLFAKKINELINENDLPF